MRYYLATPLSERFAAGTVFVPLVLAWLNAGKTDIRRLYWMRRL